MMNKKIRFGGNAHQRRVARRALIRLGQAVPDHLFPHGGPYRVALRELVALGRLTPERAEALWQDHRRSPHSSPLIKRAKRVISGLKVEVAPASAEIITTPTGPVAAEPQPWQFLGWWRWLVERLPFWRRATPVATA